MRLKRVQILKRTPAMKKTIKTSFAIGLVVGILAMLFFFAARQPEDSTPAAEAMNGAIFQADTPTPLPTAEEVRVSAAGAYTITGDELYSFRADKRWPIASITKLLTALIAYEEFGEDDVVPITKEAVATEGESGFREGEMYTVGDLVEAMLLISSNDAATALAMHYNSQELFVKKMNERAAELGMTDTSLADPTGLSFQNLSTVEDLRKLALYIWENEPQIFRITRRESGTLLEVKSGKRRTIQNINIFAGREDFLGGKTGHIPEADQNLLSIFALPNREPVVIIVLGAADRFQETENILRNL